LKNGLIKVVDLNTPIVYVDKEISVPHEKARESFPNKKKFPLSRTGFFE